MNQVADLLLVLVPVSLLDSLSVWPSCIVPMTIALGGARPMWTATAFIAGIVAVYFPFGIALALGLSGAIEALNRVVRDFWYHPDTVDVWIGLAIGVVMVTLGWKVGARRADRTARKGKEAPPSLTPGAAFALGAGFTLAGAWGALPYFAAVDLILKADPGTLGAIAVLAWYNLVLVLPLIAFASLRPLLGARAGHVFQAVNDFLMRWGLRALVIGLVLLGALIIVDSVGWLLGHPLLPVPDPPAPG